MRRERGRIIAQQISVDLVRPFRVLQRSDGCTQAVSLGHRITTLRASNAEIVASELESLAALLRCDALIVKLPEVEVAFDRLQELARTLMSRSA